jgi:serine/threonine protein kinase
MLIKTQTDTRTETMFDYATALRIRNQKYKTVEEHYIQVGTIKKTQGWILHLSAITSQIHQLIQAVVPILIREKTAFKLICNAKTAELLLNGKLGTHQIGKVFRIYPEDDASVQSLSQKLIEASAQIKGPAVPTDAYLGGTLYARYGSFNPVLLTDASGRVEHHIRDVKGNLIKDAYSIPFTMPAGISWPFSNHQIPKPQTLPVLKNTYLIISELKTDVKGRVLKTIQVKGMTIRRAVVKEARHDIGTDKFGRDIIDRLGWQFDLQTKLHTDISIPKVYDFFKNDGNQYLAMEFVKGKPLDKVILETTTGMAWPDIKIKDKLILLNYLTQVIDSIKTLHKLGYVHRDITPVNFILNNKNKITLIDLEGTYSMKDAVPNPPFDIGTVGFMPPEHDGDQPANTPEDIYSLGALTFVFATGLKPAKFLTNRNDQIEETLSVVSIDDTLHNLISQCTKKIPLERPNIEDLSKMIREYSVEVKSNNLTYNKQRKGPPSSELLDKTISSGLHTFASNIMSNEENLWHSIDLKNDHLVSAKDSTKIYIPGLYEGMSSAIYIVAKAKELNYPTNSLKKNLTSTLKFINSNFITKLPNIHPGLYHGSFGLAMTLAAAVKADLLPESTSLYESINRCMNIPTTDLSMAHGISGQCISILKSIPPKYKNVVIEKKLSDLITNILKLQQENGSWVVDRDLSTGISYGVSGIIIALISYYRVHPSLDVKLAITKSVRWLDSKTCKKDRTTLWTTSKSSKKIDPWLENGISGIILAYIHAYDILEDTILKKQAHEALIYLSNHLTQNDLSHGNGLCGLGQVYLEAMRVFKTDEYRPFVDQIANLILCARNERGAETYWMANSEQVPYAGIGNGNGGILHFLMRYNSRNQLPMPIYEMH